MPAYLAVAADPTLYWEARPLANHRSDALDTTRHREARPLVTFWNDALDITRHREAACGCVLGAPRHSTLSQLTRKREAHIRPTPSRGDSRLLPLLMRQTASYSLELTNPLGCFTGYRSLECRWKEGVGARHRQQGCFFYSKVIIGQKAV